MRNQNPKLFYNICTLEILNIWIHIQNVLAPWHSGFKIFQKPESNSDSSVIRFVSFHFWCCAGYCWLDVPRLLFECHQLRKLEQTSHFPDEKETWYFVKCRALVCTVSRTLLGSILAGNIYQSHTNIYFIHSMLTRWLIDHIFIFIYRTQKTEAPALDSKFIYWVPAQRMKLAFVHIYLIILADCSIPLIHLD